MGQTTNSRYLIFLALTFEPEGVVFKRPHTARRCHGKHYGSVWEEWLKWWVVLPSPKVGTVNPLCPGVLPVWIPPNLDLKFSEGTCGMAQVAGRLPSKCETLSTAKKKKNKNFQKRNCVWTEHVYIFWLLLPNQYNHKAIYIALCNKVLFTFALYLVQQII
jgi:hypothetical protein